MEFNTDHPVILFLKNGKMFEGNSFRSRSRFKTEFFLITDLNESTNCMTLMLLRPCSVCCDAFVLVPTDEFIILDTRCLCGYQSLPNVCIRKCNHPPVHIQDCVCGPFIILPGYDESVLWRSNLIADQYGSISLYIEKEIQYPLELKIYFNNMQDSKTYQLIDQKSYHFSTRDCSLIKVRRTNGEAKIQGIFQIELHSEIERNIV